MYRRPTQILLLLFSAITSLAAQTRTGAPAPPAALPEIPYTRYVLPNGLTLIVHEDHKAPIVSVNVWYHVGSKNERPGRTGFAHLFEHLMFNGSENFDRDYFEPFARIGATDQNGTTNIDRTNYFQNVPTQALDLALWMESDRMGHLLGAVTQAKLDEQRGVVQNEKRQGENQPYGSARELLTVNTYPAGHPYSWTTIGSMADLNAASLADVKEWFTGYYGAANAVLVVAGDVTPAEAKEKVERYFGDIPSGPPVARQERWIARRTGVHRGRTQDRVPQARIYKVWNVPGWGEADADYLTLAASVLSRGKSSRLYNRLVYRDQSATSVLAYVTRGELGGQFSIVATAAPGKSPAEVEAAIDQELARFLATGPTMDEVARAGIAERADFIRGIERIGGFGGKSDVLAESQVYGGSPDAWRPTQRRYGSATPAQVRSAAVRWLSDGVYVLEVEPYPDHATSPSSVDRSRLPEPGAPPDIRFPAIIRDSLSNGLRLVLAERPAVPVVQLELLVNAGFAADQMSQPGTASLALSALDAGTTRRTALQISDQLAGLGAVLGSGSTLDMSSVQLSALTENLDRSLEIFADVILHPVFPAAEVSRLKDEQLARIQRERNQPQGVALRLLPRLLYGVGHAYANPLTGSGTDASVRRLSREDLTRFHSTWFRPNNATLVIVGATTMARIKPALERLFGGWPRAEIPPKNLAEVTDTSGATVYLVDRPGAQQSNIYAANLVPARNGRDEFAIEALNTVLGGDFTSRINMNLREDKHWSYGAYSFIQTTRGQRPFIASAAVQTDKTSESMAELRRELGRILDSAPVTPAELDRAKAARTLTLPGNWETMDAVGASIGEIVAFGLGDHYYDGYADRIRTVTLADVARVAREVLRPEHLIWVVIGDRARIEQSIRDLHLGEVRVVDADGGAL